MNKVICVCGAGTMGSGIAQLAASSGFKTILFDLHEPGLQQAAIHIRDNLQNLVSRSKISGDQLKDIFNRITFTTDINECIADIIIEAIIENLDAKRHLFVQLAALNGGAAIYASNTSSLSINSIAGALDFKYKVAGMHFFNPAPLMKLIEIVRTNETSDLTIETLREVAKQMGKETVVCYDSPGFIVNHVARPFYLEALRLTETEDVSTETIDNLITCTGFKMGPFRLMDLIGNDINYAVSLSVYESLNKPARLKPSTIQEQMVTAGKLGKKSGEGYYLY